jgi:predicted transcriptional regulator
MDALGVPLKIRQYRLGHSRAGDITTDVYTHFQIGGDDAVANRLGSVLRKEVSEFFALNLPKIRRAPCGVQEALDSKRQNGCGGQI